MRCRAGCGGERRRPCRASCCWTTGARADQGNWALTCWGRALLAADGAVQRVSAAAVAGFRRSFAHAGEAMDRGYSVLIFPEGARTRRARWRRSAQASDCWRETEAPILRWRCAGWAWRRAEGEGVVAMRGGSKYAWGASSRQRMMRAMRGGVDVSSGASRAAVGAGVSRINECAMRRFFAALRMTNNPYKHPAPTVPRSQPASPAIRRQVGTVLHRCLRHRRRQSSSRCARMLS